MNKQDIDQFFKRINEKEYKPIALSYTDVIAIMIKEKLIKSGKSACFYTHYAMMIDWNGDALICCQDMYNRTVKFGNVAEKPIFDIWRDVDSNMVLLQLS